MAYRTNIYSVDRHSFCLHYDDKRQVVIGAGESCMKSARVYGDCEYVYYIVCISMHIVQNRRKRLLDFQNMDYVNLNKPFKIGMT